jgi:CIC family chloride channel protein
MDRLNRYIADLSSWLFRRLSNRQFLMFGAVAVGLWAGLSAVALKSVVHYMQVSITGWGRTYGWVYIVSPVIGIMLTVLFVRFVLKGELVKGTSHVMFAIARKASLLPRKEVYAHLTTSALTVGMGGSAGLESPIVQTGAAIGSVFSSFFPVGYRDRTLLLACGAAAGIATAFNAPIAGVLFALEVLLVDVNISAFIPLLIAGATGSLCSTVILSEGISLSFRDITVFNYRNLPFYIVLGILCGLTSAYYLRTYAWSEGLLKKILPSAIWKFVGGCGLLAILIMLVPALFGEGYNSIVALARTRPEALFQGSPIQHMFNSNSNGLGFAILGVALLKVFAVSLTLNAGGNGGNFAPSLLVGACIGFFFAFTGNAFGLTHLPVANFCLVAMAGVLTGIFHSPLTAVFLIAEITGGYGLIIPLMIVSATSTAVSKYLNPLSLDEAKLYQQAGSGYFGKDAHIVSGLTLTGCLEKDFITVDLGDSLKKLTEAITVSKRNIFPVLDKAGVLAGIISLEDIREIMFDVTRHESVRVEQIMRQPIAVADVKDDMHSVIEKFDKTGVWNIPVLDSGKYMGFVSKSRVLSNYREKLRND